MKSLIAEIKELTNILLGGIVVICLVWVFAPRTWHFSDTQIIYTVETSSCNQYNVCDVKAFFPPLQVRVDKSKSAVVWMSTSDENLGAWEDCIILDKLNWRCNSPPISMINGYIESRLTSVNYISGWSYRTYWLLSFLPTFK